MKTRPTSAVARRVTPADIERLTLERAAFACAARGQRRIAVFPAGKYSTGLGLGVFEAAGVAVACYLDHNAGRTLHGIDVVAPGDCPSDIDAVFVCSSHSEDSLEQTARSFEIAASVPVVAPFADAAGETPEPDPIQLQRLREHFTGRINLGCGTHPLEGWTNIDGGDGEFWEAPEMASIVNLDVFDACAHVDESSCSLIYSEQFYEHFTLEEGFEMACAWRRMLRPGGTVRIVMPDLEIECRITLGEALPTDADTYAAHKRRWLGPRHAEAAARFITPAMLLNFGMRLDGHRFLYDFDTVKAQLEAAGFVNVRRCGYGQSEIPDLRGLERHDGGETGGEWAQSLPLIVGADTPSA